MQPHELQSFLNELEENNRRIDKEIRNLKASSLKWEMFLILVGVVIGIGIGSALRDIAELLMK